MLEDVTTIVFSLEISGVRGSRNLRGETGRFARKRGRKNLRVGPRGVSQVTDCPHDYLPVALVERPHPDLPRRKREAQSARAIRRRHSRAARPREQPPPSIARCPASPPPRRASTRTSQHPPPAPGGVYAVKWEQREKWAECIKTPDVPYAPPSDRPTRPTRCATSTFARAGTPGRSPSSSRRTPTP